MAWHNPRRDKQLRSLAHKYTAADFAKAWGTTRSAVLGRAFRLGISLHKVREPIGPRPVPSFRTRGRPAGGALPIKVKAAAVAAVMAGASYRRAAVLAKASNCAVWNWCHDEEVREAATALLAAAVADARLAA